MPTSQGMFAYQQATLRCGTAFRADGTGRWREGNYKAPTALGNLLPHPTDLTQSLTNATTR